MKIKTRILLALLSAFGLQTASGQIIHGLDAGPDATIENPAQEQEGLFLNLAELPVETNLKDEFLLGSNTSQSSTIIITGAPPIVFGVGFGPDVRTTFENLLEQPDSHFLDFNSFGPGAPIQNDFLTSDGVSFASVTDVNGNPNSFRNIVSATASGRAGQIVGTPTSCCDDGQVGYEITFTDPQRFAGLDRLWNSDTLTQFFNATDQLLGQHQGTAFVGFVAATDDTSQWVSKIKIDTVLEPDPGPPQVFRQVGYSDDLFFGTQIPEPSVLLLAFFGLPLLVVYCRRRA